MRTVSDANGIFSGEIAAVPEAVRTVLSLFGLSTAVGNHRWLCSFLPLSANVFCEAIFTAQEEDDFFGFHEKHNKKQEQPGRHGLFAL